MEPYRPYVDELVLQVMHEVDDYGELTKEIKGTLLSIPTLDVQIDGKQSPLMVACRQTTASLYKCFAGEASTISYPSR